MDTYSEYGFAFPAHKVSAKTAICGCIECFIYRHGIPYSIASYQGTNFIVNEHDQGILGKVESICKDQECIQKHRGRKGHDIFGDCQILRPVCDVEAYWGVMGIEADYKFGSQGWGRKGHTFHAKASGLYQLFTGDPLKVLKSEDENIGFTLKAFNSSRSRDEMRQQFPGRNSLKVKIALQEQSQGIISLIIHK